MKYIHSHLFLCGRPLSKRLCRFLKWCENKLSCLGRGDQVGPSHFSGSMRKNILSLQLEVKTKLNFSEALHSDYRRFCWKRAWSFYWFSCPSRTQQSGCFADFISVCCPVNQFLLKRTDQQNRGKAIKTSVGTQKLSIGSLIANLV